MEMLGQRVCRFQVFDRYSQVTLPRNVTEFKSVEYEPHLYMNLKKKERKKNKEKEINQSI